MHSIAVGALGLLGQTQSTLNGAEQGELEIIETDNPNVYAYGRSKGEKQVIFYMNFGDEAADIKLASDAGNLKNYMNGESMDASKAHSLKGHDFLILVNN